MFKKIRRSLACLLALAMLQPVAFAMPDDAGEAVSEGGMRSTGVNYTAMMNTMQNYPTYLQNSGGDYSDATEAGKWQRYLYGQWVTQGMNQFAWADTGLTPYAGGASGTTTGDYTINPDVQPPLIDNTYHVYYGEQLYYALQHVTNGQTIQIEQDIDLNGANQNWDGHGFDITNVTLQGADPDADGKVRVIYNLGCKENVFIGKLTTSTVKNIRFDSAMVVWQGSNRFTGIFGDITGTGSVGSPINELSVLERVEVANSLFYNGFYSTSFMTGESYIAPLGHTRHMIATNCYSANNYLFGGVGMHVGGMFARAEDAEIQSSYSVDSVIVAAGKHSGGFISCTNVKGAGGSASSLGLRVKNCFTNNTVYGSESTGVFIGGINLDAGVEIQDCYASGTIEGTSGLGGFVGEVVAQGGRITFERCYSTSIVGMRNGGEKLGGFAGHLGTAFSGGGAITMKDCYAAGEVGASDTSVSPDRAAGITVGGFLGTNVTTGSTAVTFSNCFYDKQATAMREWETGATRDAAINLLDTTDPNMSAPGLRDIDGIRGVLTSNSEKSGAGLAAQPGANGFTGFTQPAGADANWIYDGGGDPDGKHNCGYPQISNFFNATQDDWQNHVDKVRAYSFASASAAHLNVWDRCVNTAHKTMPTTSYDTVRDVTSRFTLTSYVNAGGGVGVLGPEKDAASAGSHITWTKDADTTVSLYNETNPIPVIGYLDLNLNPTYGRSYWTADKFAPGLQWFTVKIKVGESIGTRRMRILPNLNLTPGADALNLKAGGSYNHAESVRLAYSTGARLARDNSDITQGVYPDDPAAISGDARQAVLKKLMVESGGTYTPTGSDVPASFSASQKQYVQVPANYMTGANATAHVPNNYLLARLYRAKVEPLGAKYQVVQGELLPLQQTNPDGTPAALTEWGQKLSGQVPFAEADSGRYLLEYIWVMPDARYVRASKMLVISPAKHTIQQAVVGADGMPRADVLALDMQQYDGAAPAAPTFADQAASLTKTVDTGKRVIIATQKKDPTDVITKIECTITSMESTQTKAFEKLEVGESIAFPFTYYYDVQLDGLDYFAQARTVTKYYSLQYDADKNYYYILLDQGADLGDGVSRNDVNDDYEIKLTVATPNKFWIAQKAVGGGTITQPAAVTDKVWQDAEDSATMWVTKGESATYTFAAEAGYVIKAVFVDGKPVPGFGQGETTGSYTFSDLAQNHKLEVHFEAQAKYLITANAKAGGTVSDGGAPKTDLTMTASAGQNKTVTITPDAGYRLLEILVDGVPVPLEVTDVENGKPYTYAFENISADHKLTASFTRDYAGGYFKIVSSYKGPGTVSPLGTQIVSRGGMRIFLITPDPDAWTADVTVDGASKPATTTSYTFANVQEDGTLNAVFVGNHTVTHTITATAGTGGGIAPTSGALDANHKLTINEGDSATFGITPDAGYVIDKVTVDGVDVTASVTNGQYTFANVAGDHMLHVTFKAESTGSNPGGGGGGGGGEAELPNFTLQYNVQTGGKINGTATQTVKKGTNGSAVTAIPDEGYVFVGWSDGVKTAQRQDLKIQKNIQVTAQFRRAGDLGNPDAENGGNSGVVLENALNREDHFAYIIGYPDGTARPENWISRGEVATIFFRLLTGETRDKAWSTQNVFSDVPSTEWYNNAVSTMANLGVLRGDTQGSFRPEAAITRGEFAAIAARFDGSAAATSSPFTDTDGHWAEQAIGRAAARGWITGYPDKTFRPEEVITRAEAITLINRVLARAQLSAQSVLPGRLAFPDCTAQDWFYLAVTEATNSHTYTRDAAQQETWTALRENEDWKRYETEWAERNGA